MSAVVPEFWQGARVRCMATERATLQGYANARGTVLYCTRLRKLIDPDTPPFGPNGLLAQRMEDMNQGGEQWLVRLDDGRRVVVSASSMSRIGGSVDLGAISMAARTALMPTQPTNTEDA